MKDRDKNEEHYEDDDFDKSEHEEESAAEASDDDFDKVKHEEESAASENDDLDKVKHEEESSASDDDDYTEDYDDYDDYDDDYDKYDDYEEESADDELEGDDNMSFLDHLEAFRWTLIYSLIAFIVGAGMVAVFLGDVASVLQHPLAWAYGSLELAQQNLINYRPMGVFSVILQVVFLGGLILSLPFVLYFLARFVAPALEPRELRVVKPCCLFALGLFLLGVLFSFFVVLPLSLAVAVRFNRYLGIDLLLAASEYYSLVVWFSVAMGVFFQFPLVILLLVYLEVITTKMLRSLRRHVFLGLAIFSALITPGGDPVTLLVMAGPMYLFYEISIIVGARMERKKLEQADV